jgi:hypothetical protein
MDIDVHSPVEPIACRNRFRTDGGDGGNGPGKPEWEPQISPNLLAGHAVSSLRGIWQNGAWERKWTA